MEDFAGQAVQAASFQERYATGATIMGDSAVVAAEQDGALLISGRFKNVVPSTIRPGKQMHGYVFGNGRNRRGPFYSLCRTETSSDGHSACRPLSRWA